MFRTVYILAFLLSFFGTADTLYGQLYPGDANNDGRVDNYDILAIGYGYGAVGPARVQSGGGSEAVGLPLFWAADFPNGNNYAYADANGNGQIEITDFAVVYNNYGTIWNTSFTPVTPSPVDGTAPRLGIGPIGAEYTLFGGQGLTLPLQLGSADDPLLGLNGIAFSVHYPAAHFASVNLSLADNWLSAGIGQSFNFQTATDTGIDVAITRFGANGLTGSGTLGEVSLIVIGDVLDLLPAPTDTIQSCLYITGTLAVDGLYDTVAVWSDSLCIELYDFDAILAARDLADDSHLGIWPNPATQRLALAAEDAFYRIELVNMHGATTLLYAADAVYDWQGNLPPLPTGCYVVRVYSQDRIRTRRLIINR